jgi:DNA-binding NarL/FixJ family response regulator
MGKINVLVVDDHKIVRDGILSLLQDEPDICVISQAENGKDALEKIPIVLPHLILIDISMPVMNGIECTREITKKYPEIKVLALTMLNELEHIKNMLSAGAGGYLLKNSGKEELVTAIKTVVAGQNYFSTEVKDMIMMEMVKKKSSPGKIIGEKVPLTSRELDILELILQEFTNQEIADKLFISVRTVDAHRRNLLEKTGARNTAGLVKFAIENHLFDN